MWDGFCAWCLERGEIPLPAESLVVADYLRWLIDRTHEKVQDVYMVASRKGPQEVKRWRKIAPAKPATVRKHLAAIVKKHRESGYPSPAKDPDLQDIWAGIRNERGLKPTQKDELRRDLCAHSRPLMARP